MEIKGKVVSILPLQTGEGKNGTWSKGGFVLETLTDKFPKKVCIDVWGDKMEQFGIATGDDVVASINVESREYNGKWFTNVQAWKVVKGTEFSGASESSAPSSSAPFPSDEPSFVSDEDEMPF